MRHRHSRFRMSLRGRSGLLTYLFICVAFALVLYYAWSSLLFRPPSKITYSSVQGAIQHYPSDQEMHKQQGFVIEEPPIGLNKEIERQMANEKWKRAKALQDRIDEERLLEEHLAQFPQGGQKVDSKIKMAGQSRKSSVVSKTPTTDITGSRALLYQQPDPLDGDYFQKLERLVHLDLKGAPPLVSYLEKLFPLLRKLGATGLLMEYEDMFPYTGNLSILASKNAYSLSDLQRIHTSAKENSLEIIPLVQTFGHMEFVLKYKQFIHLRENEYTPQVITPVKEESYHLLFGILDQVVKAHPDVRRIHLGCDEVYQLGQGQSRKMLVGQGKTASHLFLHHVNRVALHIKAAFPKLTPLIWDDWLRHMPYEVIADSGLPGLIEPVVWYYQHNILERIPAAVWETYGKLFPAVWVASAFKGATGSAQILTNASTHLDNNLQWVYIIRTYGLHSKRVNFRGIILTGWQRYDHFATLCELLPVGLPSLALCLQAVQTGGFGAKEETTASMSLRCSGLLDLQFPAVVDKGAKVSQDCSFPGSDVFYGVQQLWGIMEVYQKDRGLQERISGWMTDYHYRHGISNPGQMYVLAHKLNKVIALLQNLVQPMQTNLLNIFDKDTVEEWISTNLQERTNRIRSTLDKAKKFLARTDWPGRPFVEPSPAPGQKALPSAGQQSGGSLAAGAKYPQSGGNRQSVGWGVVGSDNPDAGGVKKVAAGPLPAGKQVLPSISKLSQALLQKQHSLQGAEPSSPGKAPPYYMQPVQNAAKGDLQGSLAQGLGQRLGHLPSNAVAARQDQQGLLANNRSSQGLQGHSPKSQGARGLALNSQSIADLPPNMQGSRGVAFNSQGLRGLSPDSQGAGPAQLKQFYKVQGPGLNSLQQLPQNNLQQLPQNNLQQLSQNNLQQLPQNNPRAPLGPLKMKTDDSKVNRLLPAVRDKKLTDIYGTGASEVRRVNFGVGKKEAGKQLVQARDGEGLRQLDAFVGHIGKGTNDADHIPENR